MIVLYGLLGSNEVNSARESWDEDNLKLEIQRVTKDMVMQKETERVQALNEKLEQLEVPLPWLWSSFSERHCIISS